VDDAFVAALSPAGTALDFSTYLGGTLSDQALALMVDPAGGVYVVGFTFSTNFVELEGLQSLQRRNAGGGDAFVLKFFGGIARLRVGFTASGDLILYWPKDLVGFVLQSADALSDLPRWDTVPEVPVVIGNEYAVTLPADGLQRYFRLRR